MAHRSAQDVLQCLDNLSDISYKAAVVGEFQYSLVGLADIRG